MSECKREFDDAHFAKGWRGVEKFFSRFGGQPALEGLRVLDVGCGRGNLVLHAARQGGLVTGIDPDGARITYASKMLAQEPPEVQQRVKLRPCGIEDLPPTETFELMFSKDAFEHIKDVPGVLREMRQRLAPEGRIYLGFGPLYRSPYGDHRWAEADLPWGHMYLPEKMLLGRIERRTGNKYSALSELELNQWRIGQFRNAFDRDCGLRIERIHLNQGDHPLYGVSRALSHLPLIGEFFTFNVYCVLRRA
jgi:SAM-dependent methyltransferase